MIADKAKTKKQLLDEIAELRRRNAEREAANFQLQRSEERLRRVSDAGRIGFFEWNATTDTSYLSPQHYDIFGWEPGSPVDFERWLSTVHPDDRERVTVNARERLEQARAGGRTEVQRDEYRILRDDGGLRWMEAEYDVELVQNEIILRGAVRDITERKRMEETVRRESDLLRSVMNGTRNVHLVCLDTEFNFVRVNEAYASTCGFRPDEMIGKNHFALNPNPEIEAIFARVRDTGEPFETRDKPFIFPDQPERGVTYWDWTLTPETDTQGGVTGLVFALVETTNRKRTEEKLRESEEKYRRLFTEAGLGIFHSTFDDRFIDLNHALAQMLGYNSPEEVMEAIHSISEQIYVDHPRRDSILEQVLAEGKTVTTENRYYRKSGEIWPARLHVRQVSDDTGKPAYLEGFVEDITEYKRMERQLREQDLFLSSVAKTSPAIVYVYDMETGSNVYISEAIESILGYSPAAVQALGGELFARIIHPEDLPPVIDFQSKVERANDNDILENEYRARHADGSWRVLRSRERPFLRNADGSVKQKIGIAVDITEHKRAEQALRASEENWRRLVEVFPECILVHGEGVVRYVNAAGARLLGCTSPDEAVGRSIWDIVPKDRLATGKARVRSVERDGVPTPPMELDFVRFDGSTFMGEICSPGHYRAQADGGGPPQVP